MSVRTTRESNKSLTRAIITGNFQFNQHLSIYQFLTQLILLINNKNHLVSHTHVNIIILFGIT